MRITCPKCGFSRDIPDDKLPENAELATCPRCENRFRFRELVEPREEAHRQPEQPDSRQPDPRQPYRLEDTAQDAAPAEPGPQQDGLQQDAPRQDAPDEDAPDQAAPQAFPEVEVPFERLDKYGFFPGTGLTIRRGLLSPALFYRAMPLRGLLPPMAFYVLLFQFSLVMEFIWTRIGLPPLSSMHPMLGVFDLSPEAMGSPVALFVFYPVMAAFMSFATSLLVHLVLLAMRTGERGYEATYRAMAYSNAPLVLSVLPYGHVPGMLWGFVVFFIGLKNLHRTTTLRVALAFGVLLALQFALAWMVLQSFLRSQGALP